MLNSTVQKSVKKIHLYQNSEVCWHISVDPLVMHERSFIRFIDSFSLEELVHHSAKSKNRITRCSQLLRYERPKGLSAYLVVCRLGKIGPRKNVSLKIQGFLSS